MSPPVERSITVSAPYFTQYSSLSSSSSMLEVVAELPMLALILHLEPTPMHMGSRLVVMDVGGDDHAARGDFVRMNSGVTFSRSGDVLHFAGDLPLRA